jgi:hypothetical protein
MKTVLAWHFVSDNRTLGYDSTELSVESGYVYSVPGGPLSMCSRGMHASRKPLDALCYAPGTVVCRVRCWGDIEEDPDKLVCRHRQVLWLANAERTLHEFSVWCVRNTPIGPSKTVWDLLTDPCSRKAIETKERWLEGRASKEELAAATDAARDAAWAAARDAQNRQLTKALKALR